MPAVAVIGTFDTKQAEYQRLIATLGGLGCAVFTIDVGVFTSELGEHADVQATDVAAASGTAIEELRTADRNTAVRALARGAADVMRRAYSEGRVGSAIALGGGGGTFIASEAMKALPIGVPKVIVSTIDAASMAATVGHRDLIVVPSIVDVAGSNPILDAIVANAAAAVAGMATIPPAPSGAPRPLTGLTMMGLTDIGVSAIRRDLEAAGRTTIVFATNGSGATLEELIDERRVDAVLDLTLAELAAELLGGPLTAGNVRLMAAARRGIPLVVAPGGIDVVGFGEPNSVPEWLRGRRTVAHNPRVTLVRTSAAENAQLGAIVAERLDLHPGDPIAVIPTGGFSALGAPGQPFHDPEADRQFLNALMSTTSRPECVIVVDGPINGQAFVEATLAAFRGQLS